MHNKRLKILTWHVHGNYLYYLTQVPHDFYLLTGTGHPGRGGSLPWGDNVREAPIDRLESMQFDIVLYQSRSAWESDRARLPPAQRSLPAIYLEHDPPLEHPTEQLHWANDRNVLLVHVTAFNRLMWNSGATATTVVEHGVKLLNDAAADYSLARGVVVVNNIDQRGRRLGQDIFEAAASVVPLDLIGMGADRLQQLGEVPNPELPAFVARYRFFFNPIRYTSLGLAIIEAMMVGLPIIGLATTELVTVIRNGENGFVDTRTDVLHAAMQRLVSDKSEAARMGANARRTALERFSIERFVDDWNRVFEQVAA